MVEIGELPETGSRVRFEVTTWTGSTNVEGVLLAPSSPGHATVKLINGYNVTHPLEAMSKLEVIGSVKTDSGHSSKVSVDSSLPEVHILHTGGTIASKVDYATGAVTARFEPEELLSSVPELSGLANVKTKKLGNMWSDDIRTRHWNKMAAAAAESFSEGAVGVVITHGTDTMHISAAALAFAFSGSGGAPPGRIVFTGSQRSSDRGSSDGAENLIAAVCWAAQGPAPTGYKDSTVIVMHASGDDGKMSVLPGCAARKSHSSRRDAFRGINQDALGIVEVTQGDCEITLSEEYIATLDPGRAPVDSPLTLNESTKILQLIAGSQMFADQFKFAESSNYDAVLVWGSGLGHLPLDDPGDSPENSKLSEAVSEFIDSGGHVFVATQCIEGPVHLDVYSKGRSQQSMGVVGHGSNFGPDTALVKAIYLLSTQTPATEMAAKWSEDLVGENPSGL